MILLGFEIGTGQPVYMKQAHTVALGMTQSGKTTTLEAIISRNTGSKALAFKTKRGEAGFNVYNNIQPFYRSRADWQYVESLLNVALREKVQYQPFMRWAILQVTQGHPETLRQVMIKAHELQTRYPRRKEVFEILEAYLQLVVPELEKHTFSTELKLEEGINVMDISDLQTETQYLIIAASIEEIFTHEENVTIIIPEAWESIPQGRATPVKLVAEKFIRKGAAIGNYLYIDSQDIGGIDKTPLRQCDNWVMGRMKEAHEVERLLDQVQGIKLRLEDFQTLPLGHFYAVLGNTVKKVYVLPAGVPEQMGIDVAVGKLSPEAVKEYLKKQDKGDEEEMYKELLEKEQQKSKDLIQTLENMKRELEKAKQEAELNGYNRGRAEAEEELNKMADLLQTQKENIRKTGEQAKELDTFRATFKKLMFPDGIPTTTQTTQPTKLTVESQLTEIVVENATPKEVKLTADKPTGKVMFCAVQISKQQPTFKNADLRAIAAENGIALTSIEFNKSLAYLVTQGYLIREGNTYRLPKNLPIRIDQK